jgi:hypothetical protein
MASHPPEQPLLTVLHPSTDDDTAAAPDVEISARPENVVPDQHRKEEAA